MFCLLYLSWLFASASAACSDGHFTGNNNGSCAWHCHDPDKYITDYSQITFSRIADDCYDTVRAGLKFGHCANGKNDLVYPDVPDNNGNCCPYCKCSTRDTTGTTKMFERPVQKECYSCTCDTVSGSTDLGYQCNRLYEVDDTYNWNDFKCPAQSTCTNGLTSTSGNTFYPGQGYFKDKDADEMCNTYCYCNADGSETCATGFANILASTNEGLVGAFLDDHQYEIRDCISDASRIVTTDIGPGCDSWPNIKCSCPTGQAVGDTWFREYTDRDGDFGASFGCAKCECQNGDFVDCNNVGGFRTSGHCNGGNVKEIKCHEAWGDDGCSSTNDNNCMPKSISGQTINEYVCDTTQPEAYCSWDFDVEPNETDDWYWGCGDDLICGAYFDRYGDKCMMSQYSVTYTDCNGVEQTEARTQYEYCCKTDNCNFREISTADCVENTGFSAILQDVYECSSEAGTMMFDDDCNDYEYQEITCSSIKELFKDQAICYCKAYAQLYQDSSTLWKPWIKDQIDMMFESFSQWNDVFGCNPPIVLTCDLDADGGGIGGADCNVEGNECETGYLCLSDGSCESEIVIDPNNKCTTDDSCGDDRKCETTEGFCYFSQCNNNGECTTQYGATSSCEKETKMYDNRVEYTTGSCQGSPVVSPPSVAGKSYGIFVVSVVVFGMALWV